jgi:hypothetical protein
LIDCALVDVKFKKAKSEREPASFTSRLSVCVNKICVIFEDHAYIHKPSMLHNSAQTTSHKVRVVTPLIL